MVFLVLRGAKRDAPRLIRFALHSHALSISAPWPAGDHNESLPVVMSQITACWGGGKSHPWPSARPEAELPGARQRLARYNRALANGVRSGPLALRQT